MEEDEEGQIIEYDTYDAGKSYDPAYEWPDDRCLGQSPDADGPGPSESSQLRAGHPVFRLIASQSRILPAKQKIAVMDTSPEVQIGRDKQLDGSSTPRIRLKEMEVSKLHATVYWDGARREWNVVDMGSMHGTFLQSGPVSPDSSDVGLRLSQPRAASIPQRLRHSDRLTIGSTTFEVHIHDNQTPCQGCAILEREEIPLFPAHKKTTVKRTRTEAGIDSDASTSSKPSTTERDPKKALNLLKRSLLTRHDASQRQATPDSAAPVQRSEYVDRSARRRLLHPSRHDTPPGIPNPSITIPKADSSPSKQFDALPKHIVSEPPIPLPITNVGHRLLRQQGWTPGNALGDAPDSSGRVGLIHPLEVKSSQNRAGLGMKQPAPLESDGSVSGLSWKDREKVKRYRALQG